MWECEYFISTRIYLSENLSFHKEMGEQNASYLFYLDLLFFLRLLFTFVVKLFRQITPFQTCENNSKSTGQRKQMKIWKKYHKDSFKKKIIGLSGLFSYSSLEQPNKWAFYLQFDCNKMISSECHWKKEFKYLLSICETFDVSTDDLKRAWVAIHSTTGFDASQL